MGVMQLKGKSQAIVIGDFNEEIETLIKQMQKDEQPLNVITDLLKVKGFQVIDSEVDVIIKVDNETTKDQEIELKHIVQKMKLEREEQKKEEEEKLNHISKMFSGLVDKILEDDCGNPKCFLHSMPINN